MRKKRRYIFRSLALLAATALLTAACTDSDIHEPQVPEVPTKPENPTSEDPLSTGTYPILFNATLPDQITTTRAEFINNLDDLKAKGFGMYAYYTKYDDFSNTGTYQKVMTNQKIYWDETNKKWDYAPSKYWPGEDQKLSFFAYAPYKSGTSHITMDRNTPTIPYNHDEQTDWLWGTVFSSYSIVGDSKIPNNARGGLPLLNVTRDEADGLPQLATHTGSGYVNWDFRHALARLSFSIYSYIDLDPFKTNRRWATVDGYLHRNPILYPGYNDGAYYYKYDEDWFDVKLMVTSVRLEGLWGTATLALNNTARNTAEWTDKVKRASTYELTPLNPAIAYKSYTGKTVSELEKEYKDNWNKLTSLGTADVPVMDGNNYTLAIPIDYVSGSPVKVVVQYRVITRWRLSERYTRTQNGDGSFTYTKDPTYTNRGEDAGYYHGTKTTYTVKKDAGGNTIYQTEKDSEDNTITAYYETDASGNVLTDEKGYPVYADAIVEGHYYVKDSEDHPVKLPKYVYETDAGGNVLTDSDGNPIKVPETEETTVEGDIDWEWGITGIEHESLTGEAYENYTRTGNIEIDLKDGYHYNIKIRLGEMMQLYYTLLPWRTQEVTIPPFE